MTTCKNCENTFEGKFCPNCSQKSDTHRFTLKHFLHEAFHAFTHADKGIFFLMKELFIRPGKVAREFNEGKRKRYFNPFTYLLLIIALQVFLAKKTDIFTVYLNETQNMMEQLKQAHPEVNPLGSDEMLEAQKRNNPKVLEHNRTLNLLFLPFLALLTWLFFKKSGFNYAENLVFNVMYSAQLLLFFIIIIILFVIFPSRVYILMNLYILIYLVYSFIALQQFFRQRWWLTLIKSFAILVAYYFLILQITDVVIRYA